MDEEKNVTVLDDSLDNLDEKIKKEIIQEYEEMTDEELKEQAKKDGIENSENLTREELIESIINKLDEE